MSGVRVPQGALHHLHKPEINLSLLKTVVKYIAFSKIAKGSHELPL